MKAWEAFLLDLPPASRHLRFLREYAGTVDHICAVVGLAKLLGVKDFEDIEPAIAALRVAAGDFNADVEATLRLALVNDVELVRADRLLRFATLVLEASRHVSAGGRPPPSPKET